MTSVFQVLLILIRALATTSSLNTVNPSSSGDISCPTWQFYNITSQRCECGDSIHEAVRCNRTTNDTQLLGCYCMTLNEKNGQMEVGKCFIGCEHSLHRKDAIYSHLPQDKLLINDWLCRGLNENGTFCGACQISYSRVVYSYNLNCQNCTSSHSQNVAKFVAAAFGPLTLFYILVVVFKVSATSPQLTSYVLFSQWIAEPISVRMALRTTQKFPKLDIFARLLVSAYGIWNLDFFRSLYQPICLDVPKLLPLALDYTGAFYSLFLIALTYLLIKLHSYNVKVLVCLWRPIEHILTYFEEHWSTNASMVNVFSTFFLLSYVKIVSVSFSLLVPTTIYDIHGHKIDYYLYYDASIEYFGKEHLPYGIVAIMVLLLFVIIPTLFLALYPFRWFQSCLNRCRITHQAIHTFADCYLGWFKDGTERGTGDRRFIVSLYLALRMFMFIIYTFSLSVYLYAFATIVLIMSAVIISFSKPYKCQWARYNTIDSSVILLVAMWYSSVTCLQIATEKAFQFVYFSAALCCIIAAFPLLCITVVLMFRFCKRSIIVARGLKVFMAKIHTKRKQYEILDNFEDVPVVPHRMEHPEQYT